MTGLPVRRRALLAGAAAACAAFPSFAQRPAAGRAITVAQLHDTSDAEQDVDKDFLIGSRAAWQDINARGGLGGRAVQHLTVEVDGTPAGVEKAWRALREEASCVVLSRTVSEVLARLFDEPPVALSLAGFIATHYTAEVLSDVDGAPTRANVLAAFQRRREVDVGGFRVSFDAHRRSAGFVTQSMLTADGRVVG